MEARLTQESDEHQIGEIIESQLAALSAKEVEGSIAGYVEGNVMYTMAPPLKSQNADPVKSVQEWFDSWDGPLKFEYKDMQIKVSGDLAFSTSLRRMVGDQNGRHLDIWSRKTLVFERIDGEWKIVHDHESVPFYMDGSNKAAIDLKP